MLVYFAQWRVGIFFILSKLHARLPNVRQVNFLQQEARARGMPAHAFHIYATGRGNKGLSWIDSLIPLKVGTFHGTTHPTLGKGKSPSNFLWEGIC